MKIPGDYSQSQSAVPFLTSVAPNVLSQASGAGNFNLSTRLGSLRSICLGRARIAALVVLTVVVVSFMQIFCYGWCSMNYPVRVVIIKYGWTGCLRIGRVFDPGPS